MVNLACLVNGHDWQDAEDVRRPEVDYLAWYEHKCKRCKAMTPHLYSDCEGCEGVNEYFRNG